MNDLVKKPNLFQKGVSGNPAGRPKGSKNAISIIKLQLEGEMRAQMRPHMSAVVAEIVRQALPTPHTKDGKAVLDAEGNPIFLPGNQEMLKLLFGAWVSKSKATEDEAPREKIVIQIGKLDQTPDIKGKVFTSNHNATEE